MRTVAFLKVVGKGKKYFFANGKRISENAAFKLTFNASDSDCFRTECKGDTVRHYKTLRFHSDDAYIVDGLIGE